jgi:hypothetical protein
MVSGGSAHLFGELLDDVSLHDTSDQLTLELILYHFGKYLSTFAFN